MLDEAQTLRLKFLLLVVDYHNCYHPEVTLANLALPIARTNMRNRPQQSDETVGTFQGTARSRIGLSICNTAQ
jgi:hypothetical protein